MRLARWGVLALCMAVVAGCGGASSEKPTSTSSDRPSSFAGAGARTIAAGTARFRLSVNGSVGGIDVSADESGTLSFTGQRAHIYKLLLSGGLPQEVIIDGPFEYANGNVEAAMNDATIKPWTKLDTRRLTLKQRLASANELAHVRAAAYLVYGVAHAVRVGAGPGGTIRFRGTVDPARLAARLPPSLRDSIVLAVRNDYVDGPFPADFWLDRAGRIARVHVAYTTPGGGRIAVTARYSNFGMRVKLALPPVRSIQDITPEAVTR
jgi:hypothetical protein